VDALTYAPVPWPGGATLDPGDLTQFAPTGMNLGNAPVVRPGDTLESAFGAMDYYALQPHATDPFHNAPLTDGGGGTVYFDARAADADVTALLRLMEVQTGASDFAAIRTDADHPQQQRYLRQLRIVLPDALGALFNAAYAPELVKQPGTASAAIAAFIADERERFGTGMDPRIRGTFGGDGDWAKEALCFGFMVENAYHGVYRIWSRAWLVTK
jgi:hypothetical protein